MHHVSLHANSPLNSSHTPHLTPLISLHATRLCYYCRHDQAQGAGSTAAASSSSTNGSSAALRRAELSARVELLKELSKGYEDKGEWGSLTHSCLSSCFVSCVKNA